MISYNRNLNGHFIKSKKNLLFGILLILIALWFFVDAFSEEKFNAFYGLYALVLACNGALALARFRGVLLWTTSYVKLDDEALVIKTFSKEKKVLWANVESVDFRDDKLSICPPDKKFQYVSLQNLEADMIAEIVDQVSKVAALKNIKVVR